MYWKRTITIDEPSFKIAGLVQAENLLDIKFLWPLLTRILYYQVNPSKTKATVKIVLMKSLEVN